MTECNEAPPTSLVMDRSTAYSQIIFNEVPKSYPPNVPLKCIYTVTAAIQPDRRDWVGIFKVGWNTTRDYYTFVWANSSSDPQKENQEKPHVLFDAYYLPKEDGEFYQFCYVDSAGQVRGASTPFCFKNPEDLNLQYSLENDLLVISTQAQVENEKEEFYEDVEAQKLTIEELKANLDEKLLEISLLKKSNAELSEEVSRLQQQQADREKEQIEQTLLKDDKRLEVKKEAERLVAQEDHLRMEDMQKENKELQQTLSTMKEKHEKAKTKINHLNNEREELKKKVTAQETEIGQLNSQVRELERERQQCKEKQVRLQDEIQLLQVDLQSSQKDSVKLSGELRELRSHGKKITELQSENQLLHSSLLEKEQEKTRLQETNTQQLQEIQRFEEACSRAQRFQQELEEVKKQMGRQAVSLAEKDQFIKKLESQLMETHRGVEEQVCMVEIAQSEKEELSHENQKLRGDIQTLQRQLSDVETRQSPGAISLQNSNPYSLSRLCPSPEGSLASSLVYGNPFHSDGITTDEERVCRYCNEKFPGINLIELELHEQSHRMCPFCSLVCDSMEQAEFENHVYSHEEQE